jgi:hypothetical protein
MIVKRVLLGRGATERGSRKVKGDGSDISTLYISMKIA